MAVDRDRHSLRYLLLRMLERHKGEVTAQAYREIAASLKVTRDGDDYVVEAVRTGERKVRRYPRGAFSFYRYGDEAPPPADARSAGFRNTRLARSFWEEVVGFAPVPDVSSWRRGLDRLGGDLAEAGLQAIPAAVFLGQGMLWGVGVAALFAAEGWFRHGRLLVPFLLAGLLPVLPWGAGAAGLTWGILEYLDPDPRLRTLRAAGGAAVGIAAAWMLAGRDMPSVTTGMVAAIAAGAVLLAARWVAGSHDRTFRIVFPVMAAGACADGFPALSAVWLAATCALTLVRSAVPVRRGGGNG